MAPPRTEVRILQRQPRGCNRHLRHERHAPLALGINQLQVVLIGNLSRYSARIGRGIEPGHGANDGAPVYEGVPKWLLAYARRSDEPDSRDQDPWPVGGCNRWRW